MLRRILWPSTVANGHVHDIGRPSKHISDDDTAYGTLAVNVVGCLIVGYVLTWSSHHEQDRWRLLMATGFCGAFTTFSAFAYESMTYWHEGKLGAFVLNLFANNLLCFVAVLLGIRLHRG